MKSDEKQGKPSSKPKGWHSRRHETIAESDEARTRYQAEHGPVARRTRALERRLVDLFQYQEDDFWEYVEQVAVKGTKFYEYTEMSKKQKEQFRVAKIERAWEDCTSLVLTLRLATNIHKAVEYIKGELQKLQENNETPKRKKSER